MPVKCSDSSVLQFVASFFRFFNHASQVSFANVSPFLWPMQCIQKLINRNHPCSPISSSYSHGTWHKHKKLLYSALCNSFSFTSFIPQSLYYFLISFSMASTEHTGYLLFWLYPINKSITIFLYRSRQHNGQSVPRQSHVEYSKILYLLQFSLLLEIF